MRRLILERTRLFDRTRSGGQHVLLEVSDTGTGMTEEVRQRCLKEWKEGRRGRSSHTHQVKLMDVEVTQVEVALPQTKPSDPG